MKKTIVLSKRLLKINKVVPIEDNCYDVDGKIVEVEKKRGSMKMLCSCNSCRGKLKENNICSRKIAVILFEANDKRFKRI